MITNHKQFKVTKSQMEMLQSAVAAFDVARVAQKIGSKKLAEAELRALMSQVQELAVQLEEYEKRQGRPDGL